MPFAKLLENRPCQKCYCIIPQWGPPQLNDKKKVQKEKSNFRRYNEIKTKCLLSLSNVKMFIKIVYVRVWCWGKKAFVNHLGLFFKNENHHTGEFLTFCMKWTWTRGSAYSSDISPTPCFSLFSLHIHVHYPFYLLFILHMRLKGLSLHGPKPPTHLCHLSAWRAHPGIIFFLISGSLCQSFK